MGIFDRLELSACSEEVNQVTVEYWSERGIDGIENMQNLCIKNDTAYIESMGFFPTNYAAVMFDFEYCLEYSEDPVTECIDAAEFDNILNFR